MGTAWHVNTDLGGGDGFVEITNTECYTIPSSPNPFAVVSIFINDLGSGVRSSKNSGIINYARLFFM